MPWNIDTIDDAEDEEERHAGLLRHRLRQVGCPLRGSWDRTAPARRPFELVPERPVTKRRRRTDDLVHLKV